MTRLKVVRKGSSEPKPQAFCCYTIWSWFWLCPGPGDPNPPDPPPPPRPYDL